MRERGEARDVDEAGAARERAQVVGNRLVGVELEDEVGNVTPLVVH